MYFPTGSEAYYRMLILLTTANFPDIMLPAYNENIFNVVLFMSYMMLGLYFMFNILLATVYSRFKRRLETDALEVMLE